MDVANRTAYNDQFKDHKDTFTMICNTDPAKDLASNISAIYDNTTMVELKGVVAYLKQNFGDKYANQVKVFQTVKNMTKTIVIKQIIKFVALTLPFYCVKCENEYTPMSQDDSAMDDVTCVKCKVPAHRTCYKKEEINNDHQIFFMCQNCFVSLKKTEKEEEEKRQEEEKILEEKEDTSDDDESDEAEKAMRKIEKWEKKMKKIRKKKRSSIIPSSSSEFESSDDRPIRRQKNKDKKKTDTLCPMLIDGNCPHGVSGKECEYLHKRKCYRFTDYGTRDMNRGGCRFGSECRYMHPTLCRNSVELKTCLNNSCQYAHLKFTKRSQQNEDRNNNSRSYDNHNQSQYQHPKNSKQTQARTRNSYNADDSSWNQNRSAWGKNSAPKQDQSFLEERIAKMQKEILAQMKRQIDQQFMKMQEWDAYETEYPYPPPASGYHKKY